MNTPSEAKNTIKDILYQNISNLSKDIRKFEQESDTELKQISVGVKDSDDRFVINMDQMRHLDPGDIKLLINI